MKIRNEMINPRKGIKTETWRNKREEGEKDHESLSMIVVNSHNYRLVTLWRLTTNQRLL